MKLTPRANGWRFRHETWAPEMFLDVRRVGKGAVRLIAGVNEKGVFITLTGREDDADWIRIGSTARLKRSVAT